MYGSYAIVACDNELNVVNASDPTNLSITGTLSNAQLGSGYAVHIIGDYACIATLNADRFTIVDLSTPASPTIEGSVQDSATLDSVRGVSSNGSTLGFASGFSDNRLVVLDISNLASPSVVGSVVDGTNLLGIWAVAYLGADLVACGANDGDRFTIVDVSTPASPSVVGSVTDAALNGIRDIVVRGTCVWCTSNLADSVSIIDVSNPASPSVVDSITGTNLDEATGLALNPANSLLYVGAIAQNRLTVVESTT